MGQFYLSGLAIVVGALLVALAPSGKEIGGLCVTAGLAVLYRDMQVKHREAAASKTEVKALKQVNEDLLSQTQAMKAMTKDPQ